MSILREHLKILFASSGLLLAASFLLAAGGPGIGVLVNGVYYSDIGSVLGAPTAEITSASSVSLTAAQLNGGICNNYGQTVANVQSLPAAAANLAKTFVISTAGMGAFSIDPIAGDKIYLDGTALADANEVINAVPAVGDHITCVTFKSGATSYDWICVSGAGLWVDGGA